MKLTNGEVGKSYIVASIDGGCIAKDRILKLGIIPGSTITIKRKAPLRGPFMVEVNGSDVVLGRGIASKIAIVEIK
ncbi:FeoA family protein [Hippea maritima]|uniref:FeoA family protein n=1 Tax=Hippea maritima (strain ATCC 700847 / DSM 10411 / MH2) TaxID=760142 RepID=F2LY39_HIPMA|nr:ferrous iron transport protein A [Hippea maritima]AEA34362.1 FeoA family protein [Hippea maritima DSM 10411]